MGTSENQQEVQGEPPGFAELYQTDLTGTGDAKGRSLLLWGECQAAGAHLSSYCAHGSASSTAVLKPLLCSWGIGWGRAQLGSAQTQKHWQ